MSLPILAGHDAGGAALARLPHRRPPAAQHARRHPLVPVALGVLWLALAGCSTLGDDGPVRQAAARVAEHTGVAPQWETDPAGAGVSEQGLAGGAEVDLATAVRTAFARNPRIREARAQLERARADEDAAGRLANPSLGYARLDSANGPGEQVTRSVSLGISDLLLLPARKRFAAGERVRVQGAITHDLLMLRRDVERAWYASAAAGQVAGMRALVARSAEQSAALAERFHAAGNISRLQLAQERAAAAGARNDADRAVIDALHARAELAAAMGVPAEGDWRVAPRLPAPPDTDYDAQALLPRALAQRPDILAAEQSVMLQADALELARAWRWIGGVDVGYEHEREAGGGSLRGPTLTFALPLFDQGQPAIARADAALLSARAEAERVRLAARNEVTTGVDALRTLRGIVQRSQHALLPAREAVVARTQEEVNFMLKGVFELLQAKQAEYDGWQQYLENVRDYWLARTDLRAAVGGRLPDDDAPLRDVVSPVNALPRPPEVPTGPVDSAAPTDAHTHHHDHTGASP